MESVGDGKGRGKGKGRRGETVREKRGQQEWRRQHAGHASRQEEQSDVNKNDGTLYVMWPKRQ